MATDIVILENQDWQEVHVEVRIGNNGNPDSNPLVGTRLIAMGTTWSITSNGESVFWHRDTDPDNPNGSWTAWVDRPCYGEGKIYNERII